MSYDIYIMMDTGTGHFHALEEGKNCTYNLIEMFRAVFKKVAGYTADLDYFHNQKAATVDMLLDALIEEMELNPDEYKRYNPENGWGKYENALGTLKVMAGWAKKHPNAIFVIE